MTKEQNEHLKSLREGIESLEASLETGEVSNLFAATRLTDNGATFILSANREGMIHFASILLSMAVDASEGQHFHFDEHTVLDLCEKPLILKFESGPV